jgi:hypothetical protein
METKSQLKTQLDIKSGQLDDTDASTAESLKPELC